MLSVVVARCGFLTVSGIQLLVDKACSCVLRRSNIEDCLMRCQQLEKFKFVLDYKIKELKRQIEPREKEISDMKKQIEEMDLELEQVCTTYLPYTTLHPAAVVLVSCGGKRKTLEASFLRYTNTRESDLLHSLRQLFSLNSRITKTEIKAAASPVHLHPSQ